MSLIAKANQSIAFNLDVAEGLNLKAAAIDQRLYCFAYYEPTPIPTGATAQMIFHLAVLNMYGLLWDCGPKIMEDVLTRRIYGEIKRKTVERDKCYEFFRIIYAIRTDLCHNNSGKLYFNGILKKAKDDYISANGNTIDDAGGVQTDWEKLCLDFFKRCNLLTQEIEGFIRAMTSKGESNLKATWLDVIRLHYAEAGEHLVQHVLADRYKMKQQTCGSSSNITKKDVKEWVNAVRTDGTDYYDSYLQTCKSRIDPLMDGKSCPKPAWPLDFFRLITMDASRF